MTDAEFLLRAVKALIEVAGCAYIGQAMVAAFAGARRNENFVYQFFKIITNPVTRATRFLMPRFIPDRHIPFVAFGLLLWIWLFTIFGIVYVRRAP